MQRTSSFFWNTDSFVSSSDDVDVGGGGGNSSHTSSGSSKETDAVGYSVDDDDNDDHHHDEHGKPESDHGENNYGRPSKGKGSYHHHHHHHLGDRDDDVGTTTTMGTSGTSSIHHDPASPLLQKKVVAGSPHPTITTTFPPSSYGGTATNTSPPFTPLRPDPGRVTMGSPSTTTWKSYHENIEPSNSPKEGPAKSAAAARLPSHRGTASGGSLYPSSSSEASTPPVKRRKVIGDRAATVYGHAPGSATTKTTAAGAALSTDDDDNDTTMIHSIRFQVVVWYIGPLDDVLGHLPVTFRVTLFWNDTPGLSPPPPPPVGMSARPVTTNTMSNKETVVTSDAASRISKHTSNETSNTGTSTARRDRLVSEWTMLGRLQAYKEYDDDDNGSDWSDDGSYADDGLKEEKDDTINGSAKASSKGDTRVKGGKNQVHQGRIRRHQNHGRRRHNRRTIVDVPPVSILNAVKFDIVGGAPEVTMVSEKTRLMRWSCLYNATLFQGDSLRVDKFPHDEHDLCLRLGILAHRGPGGRWDRSVHALRLATEHDSQGLTRIPHGLLVDHVTIPGFNFDPQALQFQFVPLKMMSGGTGGGVMGKANKDGRSIQHQETCLEVKLRVYRESRNFDHTIVPMLGMLNVVAISSLPRNFATATASTEIMLGIAFVQVGIRLTIDSHLPNVGYEIKIQKFMNECFWLLCFLVLETNLVFFLVRKIGWAEDETNMIDAIAATIGLAYTCKMLLFYYWESEFD